MRHEGRVENRAVFVAIGVTQEGNKEVLGLWDERHGGSQAVVTDIDGAEEPRSARDSDCLHRRIERLSGSNRNGISPHDRAALYRALSEKQSGVCELEGAQDGRARSAVDL